LGSCGRFLVSTSTRPLQEFYGAPPDQTADLAYQLLGVLESLRSNDLNYFFYFTHVDADMFGIFNNGHLFIRDASALGVIDKQEGTQHGPDLAAVGGGRGVIRIKGAKEG
jgi:hypothetical protein